MKNILLLGILLTLLTASCKDTKDNTTEIVNETAIDCTAKTAETAAKCLCDYIAQFENSELSTEDFEDLENKLFELNQKIDTAIEEGKYTEEDLTDEATKLDCIY